MSRSPMPRALVALVVTLFALLTLLTPPAARAQEPEQEAAAQESHAAEEAQEHLPDPGADDHAEDEHGAAQGHGDEGEHGAEEHHGPSAGDYVAKWINFFMLVALLWWLLVTPPTFVRENFDFAGLKVVLAARASDIVQSRDLARQQVEQSRARLEESETRLSLVEQEAAGLVTAAEADAERERERLVAEARAEADKIRAGADRDLGAEVNRARRRLRRHVADLSVGIAADLLKNNFSGEDQDRLVREYLDRLAQTT